MRKQFMRLCFAGGLRFLFFLQPSLVFGFPVSQVELGSDVTFVYNRVFASSLSYELRGGITWGRLWGLKGGFSTGTLGTVSSSGAFTRLEIRPLNRFPLTLNFQYSYNGIPGYHTAVHGLIPYAALEWRRFGISLGSNFRYTRFFSEEPILESLFVFSLFFHILNTERITWGIKYANLHDFLAGNMGSYSLSSYQYLHLTRVFSLHGELELLQTGSTGLSSNFYGFRGTGGARFRW